MNLCSFLTIKITHTGMAKCITKNTKKNLRYMTESPIDSIIEVNKFYIRQPRIFYLKLYFYSVKLEGIYINGSANGF